MASRFDQVIDRKNTGSLKYDLATKLGMPEDIIPLWVADMDFRSPDCVIEALAERCRHGVFGYSDSGQIYFDALKTWFENEHGFMIEPDWLVKAPGVVYAINIAIRSLTFEGEGVLIQEPVYYPFAESVRNNGRKLSVSELRFTNGRYSIDLKDFEKRILSDNVRMFILCSPHNPVGRVWTRDELTGIGEICHKYGVIVVSDEIHMDFVFPGHKHLVFSEVKPEFRQNSIICTAPTKTFNLAGLQISNIFIPNKELRLAFKNEIAKSGHSQINVLAQTACRAAYLGGKQWLEELREYLLFNLNFMNDFLSRRIPRVKLIKPEGTYLVWLDFSGLGLGEDELEELIVKKARLWLDKGTMFGKGGSGFQRVNIACPRSVLEEALLRLEKAVNG